MFSFVHKDIDFAHKRDEASRPTEDYNKHLHYFNEVLYFIAGDAKYTVEGESSKLSPGDIVLIKSGKYHFATVNSSVEYERYVLKFPDSVLPDFLVEQLASCGPFLGNASKYSIFFSQYDSYYDKYSDEEIYSLFVCDLVKLLIMLSHQPSGKGFHSPQIIIDLITYIDDHIHEHLTLDSIADHFNFSKSNISDKFKYYMHIPIMRYVTAKKMVLAHKLILAGEKKSDVAIKLGFEDYSTFYRCYKRMLKSPFGSDTPD